MRQLTWTRITVIAAVALASLVVLGGVTMPHGALAAGQPFVNSLNYGSPANPQSIVPSDMDVQIHRRDPSNAMEAMNAGHGADCSAPPATHAINTLAQGVFSCKNHLMTAVGDSGYGEIALTPNYMADWSSGTTTITFNVSTQQNNDSDWIEIWITPFADNMNLPFEDQIIDFQGPPKNAIVFSLNKSGLMGTNSGDVSFFQNYIQGNNLPKLACLNTGDPQCISPTGLPSVVSPSAVTRVQYEIDISSGHIKFGLPGIVTWTDTNVSVPFSKGVVQLVHHSYNPAKHAPGTEVDTFHWSNLTITNADPFTIINGAERSINAGTPSAIHFPAPAPTGSYLRFSALGTISMSWDGGATYHPAVLQGPLTHIEHFSSYMTPIPAGAQTVLIAGTDNAYGQFWWIRDPAIWSLTDSATPPSPTVGSLVPNFGPAAGGTSVMITGTNFGGVTAVKFGTVAASTYTVNSATQITATSPAGSGAVDVTVTTAGGTSATSSADLFTYVQAPGPYHPLSPTRILDTRTSLGGHLGRLGPQATMTVQITGQGGVPSTGVLAVVMNVTVTNTTAASFLTVYPAGVSRPLASNLNWVAGQTVPNLVEVAVGAGGKVAAFNSDGSTDVMFDVAGYVSVPSGTPGTDGLYNPVVPNRILDTRTGNGPVGPGQTINVQVGGLSGSGVPATGVSAVVLNVTATGATAPSFLTVYPMGTSRAQASNLNFTAGQTVPNRVIVKVGSGGWVSIYNAAGSVNVLADVGGWFTDGTDLAATGADFGAMTPTRLMDTRGGHGPIGAGGTMALTIAGLKGVPANATAVVLNVTVTGPTATSFVTVWPAGASRPASSDLNYVAGQIVANLVVVKVGSGGVVDFYNAAGSTQVIVDVVGWYGG